MANSGRPVEDGYILASPQAFDQARGLADDNLTVDQFREGVDIAEERKAENKAARRLAKGKPAKYPEALVTPHG